MPLPKPPKGKTWVKLLPDEVIKHGNYLLSINEYAFGMVGRPVDASKVYELRSIQRKEQTLKLKPCSISEVIKSGKKLKAKTKKPKVPTSPWVTNNIKFNKKKRP